MPGPICYSKNGESVIIANSNLEVECYSYQSMKVFTNNDIDKQRDGQAREDDKKKSRMEASWIANLGEQPRQIKMHANRYTEQCDVIVLCESTLFVLNELSGRIRYQKRYTFSPACIFTYHLKKMGADLHVAASE